MLDQYVRICKEPRFVTLLYASVIDYICHIPIIPVHIQTISFHFTCGSSFFTNIFSLLSFKSIYIKHSVLDTGMSWTEKVIVEFDNGYIMFNPIERYRILLYIRRLSMQMSQS